MMEKGRGWLDFSKKTQTRQWNPLNPPFRTAHRLLKQAQNYFGILVVITALLFYKVAFRPELRRVIVAASWNRKGALIITEAGALAYVANFVGMNRLPINYISAGIMRILISVTSIHHFEPETESPLRGKPLGPWEVFGRSKVILDDEDMADKYTALLIISALILIGILSTWMGKFNCGRLESPALIGCFVSSTCGTLVILAALAIQTIGRDNHLILTKIWIYFNIFLAPFLLFFLYHRIRLYYSDDINPAHMSRVQLETMITLVQICVVIQYIKAVHPTFSLAESYRSDIMGFNLAFLPKQIEPTFSHFIPILFSGIYRILLHFYMAWPLAMQNEQ